MKKKLMQVSSIFLSIGLMLTPATAFAVATPIAEPITYVEPAATQETVALETTSEIVYEKPKTIEEPTETFPEPVSPMSALSRSAQPLNSYFPDPNFAQAVANYLGTTVTSNVTQADLDRITYISADMQNISSIEGIQYLTNLQTLRVCANNLTSIPDEIGELSKLQYLYLYQNKITSLPNSIGDLDQLIYLNLANNGIESLPNSIYSLSNLQVLSLHDNKLSGVNNAIRNLTQLRELYLHNNELLSLPSGIGSLTNLQYLYLNKNQLDALPNNIGNLTNLYYLPLNDNQLKTLPDSIGNLTNVYYLYLNNNQLTSLPDSISNLTNLYDVQLHHNQLTDLPMNFLNGSYYYYGYLNLSYNNFSKVPQTLYQNLNNRWYSIDFSHNQFEVLDSNVLAAYTPASGSGLNYNFSYNNIKEIPSDVANYLKITDGQLLPNQTASPSAATSSGLYFSNQTATTETKTIAKGTTLTGDDVLPSIIITLDNIYNLNNTNGYLTITQGTHKVIYSLADVIKEGISADQAFPTAGTYTAEVKTYNSNSLPIIVGTASGYYYTNTTFHTYTYEVNATGTTIVEPPVVEPPVSTTQNLVVNEAGMSNSAYYEVYLNGTFEGTFKDGTTTLTKQQIANQNVTVKIKNILYGATFNMQPQTIQSMKVTVKNGEIIRIMVSGNAQMPGGILDQYTIPVWNYNATAYRTKTGAKFHIDGCSYVKSTAIKTTVEEALWDGLEACSVCLK